MDLECQWTPLQEPLGRWLGVALAVAGSAGAALSSWLAGALLLGKGSPAPSPPTAQLLLLAAALASLGRSLLAGFPFAATSALAGRWLFGRGCCALFAALRLLLEAALRAAVALLAAQRCASAAGPQRAPSLRSCLWAIAGACALAAACAAAPLLGCGRFGCDVSGFWCELDWRPDGGVRTAFDASYLLVGVATPLLLAFFCSLAAVCRVKGACSSAVEKVERELDKVALAAAAAQLLCGLPSATAQALLLLGGRRALPTALRVAAPLALEVAPAATTLALLAAGPRVRTWLWGSPSVQPRRPRSRPRRSVGAPLLNAR